MDTTDPLPPGQGVRAFPGEPVVPRWREQAWSALARELLTIQVGARPVIVAIDGRSGSGKTRASAFLAGCVPGAVVLHTDDVAWWESFFDWDALLAAGILLPARQGGAVSFRPPAWLERGREGALEVPAGCPLLLVEGVGSSRSSLSPLLDAAVWVQSDRDEARRRGLERDGGDAAALSFWEEWQAAEVPFLASDRPWDRADIVLCGTPEAVPVAVIDRSAGMTVREALARPPADPGSSEHVVLRGIRRSPWQEPDACRC